MPPSSVHGHDRSCEQLGPRDVCPARSDGAKRPPRRDHVPVPLAHAVGIAAVEEALEPSRSEAVSYLLWEVSPGSDLLEQDDVWVLLRDGVEQAPEGGFVDAAVPADVPGEDAHLVLLDCT